MTFIATTKQSEVLNLVRKRREVAGIYALAEALGRPYNRVRDHVEQLRDAGLLEIVESIKAGRRVRLIRPAPRKTAAKQTPPQRQPQLSYNRFWSSPVSGVSNEVFIAGVVAEPTLDDLVRCCLHFGTPAVTKVYQKMLEANEISPLTQKMVGRMLANIEIGFRRAA